MLPLAVQTKQTNWDEQSEQIFKYGGNFCRF